MIFITSLFVINFMAAFKKYLKNRPIARLLSIFDSNINYTKNIFLLFKRFLCFCKFSAKNADNKDK